MEDGEGRQGAALTAALQGMCCSSRWWLLRDRTSRIGLTRRRAMCAPLLPPDATPPPTHPPPARLPPPPPLCCCCTVADRLPGADGASLRCSQVRQHVDPVTGGRTAYTPRGRFVHVAPPVPRSDWATNFGRPWWSDPQYVVGEPFSAPPPILIFPLIVFYYCGPASQSVDGASQGD